MNPSTASPALLTVRVIERQVLNAHTVAFALADAHGAPLPPATAGSHIDVHTPGGRVRQYSLLSPHDGGTSPYRIAVQREENGRGGSLAMHQQVPCGEVLQIGPPRNAFELDERAPRTLLVAGGIGVTPILAMARRLYALGADFAMHYCTRSREHAALLDEIAAAPWRSRVDVRHDDTHERLDWASLLAEADPRTHLYVCGPAGFMNGVVDSARQAGWSNERIHREYFSAAPVVSQRDGAFEIKIQGSGQVVQVAANQTALNALLAAGIRVPTSCEQGICGTCQIRVVAGDIDHRDFHLSAKERARNDRFMPCCSRAHSPRLVIAV